MFFEWFEARYFSRRDVFKNFRNLDDVFREAREELSTYRDILEISDRVKKSEPKKEFGKEKRDYPKSVATFPKKNEATQHRGQLLALTRSLDHLA